MKKVKFHFSLAIFLCCSILVTNGCANDESATKVIENEASEPFEDVEVLFVGNSHTYYNSGLAFHVGRFRENEDSNIVPYIKEVTSGGYSLADHIENTAIAKINERDWDFIILQENTFIAANESESSITSFNKFKDVLSQKRAKVLLFMTWEYKDEPDMYERIRKTYNDGALITGGQVVRVGEVWRNIIRDSVPNINLYAEDGFHPGPQGTFLAAAMFYNKIYGKSPSDNTYSAGMETEIADYLKLKAN